VESYADMGPSIRRGAVLVGYRPDPDKPSGVAILGARAVIIYDWMHAQGLLTDEQREAADRYLVRLEQATGAVDTGGKRRGDGGDLSPCPTERIVRALADLRRADAVLGVDRDMAREIIGWNRPPQDGIDEPRFAGALQRLVALWQKAGRGRYFLAVWG
ncbi:MAG: hypothetical protein WAZ12_00060, partial [Candidatus Absconditicoccaceae bacterium]